MFTLEIDGKAIAVINGDEATARDLFTCDGFKEDIRTLTVDGSPIWNGTSELKVRPASQDEVVRRCRHSGSTSTTSGPRWTRSRSRRSRAPTT